MGRQAYLNRLALGRSPYEPPETGTVDPSNPVRRVSHIHSDNYMQQYDARGHPVNPESRTLGRDLRRAKNDILSTMGIVVSGEDRNATTSNEQQKIDQIATENDFGLVITTLDQLFVFFSTWWSSSLTGRILTFKHYTHDPLLDVIRSERDATGVFGFYCAGIPAWAASSTLAIARDNPLKRVFVTIRDHLLDITGNALSLRALFGLTYSAARTSVLILSLEAYMYSMLQTLSLVPSNSVPSLQLLIPFGETSLFRLPNLPNDLSLPSLGAFLMQLMTSPGVLTFVYAFYLRPELEERIYRLIRRQLPKPVLADELSIRVAIEENLVEWIVPTLGRRSEEETRRAKLTFMQDIKQELVTLRGWIFSLFGLFSSKESEAEKIERLRKSIEALEQRVEENQQIVAQNQQIISENQRRIDSIDAQEELQGNATDRAFETPSRTDLTDIASPDLPPIRESAEFPDSELDLGMTQVLTNENRLSQSPGEMSNDFFSEMATVGRTSAPSNASRSQSQPSITLQGESPSRNRQNSRSNTLFSRPSSPETSPPTSPRVRASLIHQSSDIITMQLELLGNRNRNPQNQSQTPRQPSLRPFGRGHPALRPSSTAVDRRSIADFLEALILSQAQQQATQSPSPEEPEDIPGIEPGANENTDHDISATQNQPQTGAQDMVDGHPEMNLPALEEHPLSDLPSILPDGVEEPNDDDFHSLPPIMETTEVDDLPSNPALPPISHGQQGAPLTNQSSFAHRVTLLSAHPVDSLASHLAAVISTIILSPLESLYVRSLAHSFLASHPSSAVQISDLHPTGLWFGGGTWSDAFAYCGRLVLMRGMQAALRAGVWGFLVGSTMRIGRKFCGWGTL